MSRLTLFATLPLCLALAACGSAGDRPPPPKPDAVSAPLAGVGDMCSYAERKKPVIVAHKFWTGRAYFGDLKSSDLPELRAKWFLGGSGGKVSTSVARPKLEVYRLKTDGNCYDAEKKVYYSCTKTVATRIGDIRVVGRAINQRDADFLALEVCNSQMRDRIEKQTQIERDTTDLRCVIVARKRCPLPPPAPKKKTEKKSN